jgi:hypothetical protein
MKNSDTLLAKPPPQYFASFHNFNSLQIFQTSHDAPAIKIIGDGKVHFIISPANPNYPQPKHQQQNFRYHIAYD